jgi:hypothetical protein
LTVKVVVMVVFRKGSGVLPVLASIDSGVLPTRESIDA